MRAHGVSSLALVLVCATTGHAVGDMVDNDEREQILSCPPATSHHLNGKHCVCLPGFACVEPETGGRFDHCSHGHEVGGSLTVPAAHRNLSGYRHRKCPSCRCDPRKTQVQGAPAAVVKSTSDDCRWEALRSGTRDSQTDNDTSRCSLPTTLGSLDLGFTLVEIEPCRIDPGSVTTIPPPLCTGSHTAPGGGGMRCDAAGPGLTPPPVPMPASSNLQAGPPGTPRRWRRLPGRPNVHGVPELGDKPNA